MSALDAGASATGAGSPRRTFNGLATERETTGLTTCGDASPAGEPGVERVTARGGVAEEAVRTLGRASPGPRTADSAVGLGSNSTGRPTAGASATDADAVFAERETTRPTARDEAPTAPGVGETRVSTVGACLSPVVTASSADGNAGASTPIAGSTGDTNARGRPTTERESTRPTIGDGGSALGGVAEEAVSTLGRACPGPPTSDSAAGLASNSARRPAAGA
jgi:hypothetical protein